MTLFDSIVWTGLSAAATAAVMKKFHWDMTAARLKYRECDDDPFQFSAAMSVVSDLAEGCVFRPCFGRFSTVFRPF